MGNKYVSGYIRMFRIDEMLRSGSCRKLSDLAVALGVSTRTISRDIEFMRKELFAPIVYDKANNTYRYDRNLNDNSDADPYFSLTDFKYSQTDLSAFAITDDVLRSLFGRKYFASTVAVGISSVWRHAENMPHVSRQSLKNRILLALPEVRSDENLSPQFFLEAMENNLCVRAKASAGGESVLLRPVHLVFAWDSWYVLYVTKDFKSNRDFCLQKLSCFKNVRVASANESKNVKDIVSVSTGYEESDGGIMFYSHADIRGDTLRIRLRHSADSDFVLEYKIDGEGNLTFVENASTMLSGHEIELVRDMLDDWQLTADGNMVMTKKGKSPEQIELLKKYGGNSE